MAIVKPFLRTPYNYDLDEASNAACVEDFGPSLTVQSQSEDADINVLMERYKITGRMPENPRVPQYVDLDGAPLDYATALAYVENANEGFMELPAKVRDRFANDPQRLLAFVSDDANREEAEKLGLLKPVEVVVKPEPVRVIVENPEPKV